MKPNDFLRDLIRKLPHIEQRIINEVIAVEASAQWSQSFRQQGFTDVGFSGWPARQTPPLSEGGQGGERALLVKTGRLKRAALKGRIAQHAVQYVFPEAYMRIHNEGGTFIVTAKQRRFFWAMYKKTKHEGWKHMALANEYTIPKRQFIGESQQLINRLNTKAQQLITKYLTR